MYILKWQSHTYILLITLISITQSQQPPNVLFIMVDDMGWNDVSFHGGDQIMTPNLDAMAYQGVILKQYYSETICTPARSALLTGKYPMRTGMGSTPLRNSEDRGIPLAERLLPSHMKDLGYSTHLVGKWHVGMSRNEYLPTLRGFDTHYGIRGGFGDFYTHDHVENNFDGSQYYGLDFFDGLKPIPAEGRHIVDAFTDKAIDIINNHNQSKPLFLHLAHTTPHAGNEGAPLQPTPSTDNLRNKHIAHSDRRLYADMVTNLDNSFGHLISALQNKNMLDNTIVIFVSDNGAPTVGMYRNWGVNLPLRGQKWTPWDGGARVPAFIWHPSLKPKVWDGLMHITDWFPTLLGAAGVQVKSKIDGINQWPALQDKVESERKDILVSLDNVANYASYRFGDYKILLGNVSSSISGYYGDQLLLVKSDSPDYYTELNACTVAKIMKSKGRGYTTTQVTNLRKASEIRQVDLITDKTPCLPTTTRGCLYNVRLDPSESHDLWDIAPPVVELLSSKLLKLWDEQIPRKKVIIDPRCNPAYTGYVWMPWIAPGSPEIKDDTPTGVLYEIKSDEISRCKKQVVKSLICTIVCLVSRAC